MDVRWVYVAAFACAPHGPSYGKVALVRMFLIISVGCMQSLVASGTVARG